MEQVMTNKEKVEEILTRSVTPVERHKYHSWTNNITEIDSVIKTSEAVLMLAGLVDDLEKRLDILNKTR